MPCLSSASIEAAPLGFRFVAFDAPCRMPARGTVLFAPPFAEEMNKSRRCVAQAARALAADGWRVVRPDLYGCGDSSGDFGDATWGDWIDDLKRLLEQTDRRGETLWLWGLRAGALLLPPLLGNALEANLLLWQPATSGAAVLNQFLLLKTIGAMTGGIAAPDRKTLRAQLEQGEALEIAGYLLSPALARALEAARLELPDAHRGRVVWMEVGGDEQAMLTPAASGIIERWRTAGRSVHAERVQGPPFWQTVEIADATHLVARTRAVLGAIRGSVAAPCDAAV